MQKILQDFRVFKMIQGKTYTFYLLNSVKKYNLVLG